MICISAYFPGDEDTVPPEDFKELINYCKRSNKKFIVGCDANSHHEIWGSSDTNSRGEYLYDFLLSNNIMVLNRGVEPTLVTSVRKEVLDLTLASPCLSTKISNWSVSDEASLSDHRHIVFEVECSKTAQTEFRNPRSTNWEFYKEILLIGLDDFRTSVGSIDDLEDTCNRLNTLLNLAYESSCPIKHLRETRQVPWWNRELSSLRSISRKLFNKAKIDGNWGAYRQALAKYNQALRKSKKKSWRDFCEGINETPTLARLQKVLSKDHSNGIGLLVKSNGEHTSNSR